VENFKYPLSALDNGIEGVVELDYIIEANGHISNIKPVKSLGAGCTEEAIRLLKSISWSPAIKNNQLVRVKHRFKLMFNLDEKSASFDYMHNFQNSSF